MKPGSDQVCLIFSVQKLPKPHTTPLTDMIDMLTRKGTIRANALSISEKLHASCKKLNCWEQISY